MTAKKKPAAKKASTPKPKKIVKKLIAQSHSVKLSAAEESELGRKMAEALTDMELVKVEAKQAADEFKTKLSSLAAQVAQMASTLKRRTEIRPVDCEEVKDYKKDLYTVKRLDTKQIVEKRKLRDDEKQLFFPVPKLNITKDGKIAPGIGGDMSETEPEKPVEPLKEELVKDAIKVVAETQRGSMAAIQRRFRLDTGTTIRVMEELEKRMIVGPCEGSKGRAVLVNEDGTPLHESKPEEK